MPSPTEAELAAFSGVRERDIDVSDIPELGADFWKHAQLMPALVSLSPKQAVSIRIDSDVLEWFKAHGKKYQSRINAVLRAYVASQEPH
ncbi:MAG: BrnA antitoxin family protein [Rickettsiales bacterium]|nr:BrnA antitoxin family protein [Rickettsiales bacterium]